jgi:hypothetical protein
MMVVEVWVNRLGSWRAVRSASRQRHHRSRSARMASWTP